MMIIEEGISIYLTTAWRNKKPFKPEISFLLSTWQLEVFELQMCFMHIISVIDFVPKINTSFSNLMSLSERKWLS